MMMLLMMMRVMRIQSTVKYNTHQIQFSELRISRPGEYLTNKTLSFDTSEILVIRVPRVHQQRNDASRYMTTPIIVLLLF